MDTLAWYAGDLVLPWAKARFTFTPKFETEPVALYRQETNRVGIPRGLVDHLFAEHDDRTKGEQAVFAMRNQARNSAQAKAITDVLRCLHKGESLIFRAPTGFGKTYCALSVIQSMGRVTMVVVTKDDLMEQWRKAILQHTTIPEERIGVVQQDVCEVAGRDIIIGMVHTLSKNRMSDEDKDRIGMVVWDEVHRLGADTFSETATMFPARYRLGLSATPQRVDGKDPVFLSHIGPVRVTTSHLTMRPKVIVDRVPFRVVLPHWYVPDPGKLAPVHKGLAADQARNTRIVSFVLRAYRKGRKVIIFSDLKEAHLKVLHALAITMGIPEDQMGFYVGGLSEKQREVAKTKPVLWATYAMTSEATDIPWLDTAVLATPRANVEQAIGRVLREWPDKLQPVVYDVVDQGFSILEALGNKRLSVYRSLNSEIVIL